MQPETPPLQPRLRPEGDKLIIDVSWDHADALQAHLRERGFSATLVADAPEHQASLELPAEADVVAVHRLLQAWSP
jgi:hypothetical protein